MSKGDTMTDTREPSEHEMATTLFLAAKEIIQDGVEAGSRYEKLAPGGVRILRELYLKHQAELLQLAEGYPPKREAVNRLLQLLMENAYVLERWIVVKAQGLCD